MDRACHECGTVYPLADFGKNARYPDGKARRCSPCNTRRALQHNQAKPADHARRNHKYGLKRNYGMTLETYDQMAEDQGHTCAICAGPNARRLAVDHDHTTGAVRGLLCDPCNLSLGLMQDDPSRLRAAAAYIELHQKAQ